MHLFSSFFHFRLYSTSQISDIAVSLFELLFPADSRIEIPKGFVIDQGFHVIPTGKTLVDRGFVLGHPSGQVVGYADIERPVSFAGQDIDKTLVKLHRSLFFYFLHILLGPAVSVISRLMRCSTSYRALTRYPEISAKAIPTRGTLLDPASWCGVTHTLDPVTSSYRI